MRVNYYAQKPSAKIIVWAHNGHMSKSPLNQEIGLMGATVAKAYPGQYYAIGLATAEGQYSYMKNRFINDNHEFKDSLFVSTHLPVDSTSWNALFASQGSNSYLLNFSKLAAGEDSLFARKRPFKVLGYQKEKPVKKDLYFNVSIAALYDALIFVRKTSATTPLFNPPNLPE